MWPRAQPYTIDPTRLYLENDPDSLKIQNLKKGYIRAFREALDAGEEIKGKDHIITEQHDIIKELEAKVKKLGGGLWPIELIEGKVYESRLKGKLVFIGLETGSEMYSPVETPYFEDVDGKRFFIHWQELSGHFNCPPMKERNLIDWLSL